jgi:hypothetical protein
LDIEVDDMSKYLSMVSETNFGFKDDTINQISDNDILIEEEVYNQFLLNQSQGQQYIVKNKYGSTFNDIFKIKQQQINSIKPTIEQQQIALLLLITAQQAQQITTLQQAVNING